MDSRMQTTAEAAARLLLQIFQEEHPEWSSDKTPVDTLVDWLGLQVATFHAEDYAHGTYGFMDPDEDENLIWLRRDLSETFRRFTLAHELGHAILHCHNGSRLQTLASRFAQLTSLSAESADIPELSRTDPCHDLDVQEDILALHDEEQFQEMLGIGQSYDPRSQRELAANIFAAELLMPLERVRTLYHVRRIPPQALASTFGVSQAALLNRLAGLLTASLESGLAPQSREASPPDLRRGEPLADSQRSTREPPTREPAKKTYDEFQQAAITAPTPALIVAGPGSGKTSTLIGRTEYIIRTLNVQPQQILALTFSRKAALEMEERLRQVLVDTMQALPKVSTFHAFCADLLRQHGSLLGLRAGFTLIDEAEGYFLLRQIANKLRLRHYQKLQAPTYYFPDMLKAISRAKDELVSPAAYTLLAQQMKEQARDEEALEQAEKALEIAQVYALYEQELQARGDTDFGGLLASTVQLLQEHPTVLQEQQQQYQHILVDEFQDVNRASGVLLRVLASETQSVWVVGDSNQAIYGFRGASPANISQFASDFPGAAVLPLSRNYRSNPDLVSLAESFRCVQLELGQEPGKNQPVRLTQPGTAVTLAKAVDEACEMAGIVQDIRRKHASGYAYRDMVILCRTRTHAKKISRTLAAEGLPVIERGGMLEQEHIKDALSMLLLLTDSSGMGLLRAARQHEHALTPDDIEAFLLAAQEQKTSPAMLLSSSELPLTISVEGRSAFNRLSEITQTLLHAPTLWSLLAQYLLIETTLVRDLLADSENPQNPALLADYDALLQLARHYDQQQQARHRQHAQPAGEQGEPLSSYPTTADQIRGFLEYLSLLVLLRQDGGNRQSADEQAKEQADIIRVMTVHASKGLEFPIVYMPGLTQQRFPSIAHANPVAAPIGMLPPESTGKAAHESGESCLFYVGVTRARDHLLLSYSERYGKKSYKRSLYLDALMAGLPEERISKLYWEPKTVGTLPSLTQTDQPAVAPGMQPGEAFIQARQPTTLSASAIEDYQRCPRYYAYYRIYRFAGEPDGYQLFWQATQKTIEELRQRIQSSPGDQQAAAPLPSQKEIQDLYTQHWQALEGHTAPFASMYEEHAHEIVEKTRRKLIHQDNVTWEARPGVNVDVAGKIVQVTIDRIESSTQTGEPVKFVRARYGKRASKPTPEMRELFYLLASRQVNPGQSIELHSHNMSTGEIVPIKMTPKKEQSLYEELEQSIKAMERHEYPARPAEPRRCPTCPFFLICPA